MTLKVLKIYKIYGILSNENYSVGGITLKKIVIEGKTRLRGEVTISGAKNAAVAILPATLLVNGICTLENVPQISDIKTCCKILETLGAKIREISDNTLEIDSRNITCAIAPIDLTSRFRASYYLTGALLGRCHHAVVGMPGGCNLGAKVEIEQGVIEAKAKKLEGNSIYLDTVSVGATINAMLASVLANRNYYNRKCSKGATYS